MVQKNTFESGSSNSQNLDALREGITKKALDSWVKNNYRGTFEWVTGLGKTKAAIEAIKIVEAQEESIKILYFCPTIAIIANTKNEFKKFDCEYLLEKVEFACYASIKNYFNKRYSLIIFDEAHNLGSTTRILFLKNCRSNSKLLGLSAKIPPKLLWHFSNYMPIIDSQKLENVGNLVADFLIVNVPLEFTAEEKKEYIKISDSIINYKQATGNNNWKLINKRKNIILNAKNKIEAVKHLISLFTEEKGIIFTLSSETADLFKADNSIIVHNKKGKKFIESAINDFKKLPKPAYLSVVRMYDEGVTIDDLSYAIIHSSFSVETQFIQRVGRTLRKDTDIPSLVFRLFIKGTVEENWLENSQKSFKKIIHLQNLDYAKDIINSRKNK